jgi:hypothetical protein
MPRPVSVIVFGTLNLVFGAFSLLAMTAQVVIQLSGASAVQQQFTGTYGMYQTIMTPIGLAATIAQVVSGMGLLLLKPWARKLGIYFAIYTIISTTFGVIFMIVFRDDFFKQMAAGMPGGQVDKIFQFVFLGMMIFMMMLWYSYPGLMWYFLSRPHVIAAFRGEAPPVVDYGELGTNALAVQAALSDTAPSDNPFAAPTALVGDKQTIAGLDTLQNQAATMALYLGIGSLIPCAAIGLGPAAVVVGRRALAQARSSIHRTGETQAMLGLILGGGCFLLNVGLLLFGLVMMAFGLAMQP